MALLKATTTNAEIQYARLGAMSAPVTMKGNKYEYPMRERHMRPGFASTAAYTYLVQRQAHVLLRLLIERLSQKSILYTSAALRKVQLGTQT